jgi:hypothetical protein
MRTIGLNLNSGLGNQLFMIFALISYCIDYLNDYIIYYDPKKMRTYWDTILDSFKEKTTTRINVLNKQVYDEPHFHYAQLPEWSSDFIIKGYFQSDKYFKHNFKRISEIMKLEEKKKQVRDEYEATYFKRKTIALHFRIGDYIGLQGYHCIKSPEYYIKAFTRLSEELKDINDYDILYFCQETDNHIVNQYLDILRNHLNLTHFVNIADDIPDWKQMLLMSQCDHFVIANSTFSWFGAYLSDSYQNHKAIVFYPSIWFGPLYASHNTKDLCPIDWTKIDG